MPRPTKHYSKRNVASYERDKEYLIRLRSAIWLDSELDSTKITKVVKQIDDLLLMLRDLAPSNAA